MRMYKRRKEGNSHLAGLQAWEKKLLEFSAAFEKLSTHTRELYEDYKSGEMGRQTYDMLLASYEKDLSDITTKISVCEERIALIRSRTGLREAEPDRLIAFLNGFDGEIESFSGIDITLLLTVIDRILISERKTKYSKTCEQKIEIIFK